MIQFQAMVGYQKSHFSIASFRLFFCSVWVPIWSPDFLILHALITPICNPLLSVLCSRTLIMRNELMPCFWCFSCFSRNQCIISWVSPCSDEWNTNTWTHCSKSSFFVQKFNFDFPKKLSIFLVKNSWKCCGFGPFSCWQLWFHEKSCQKNYGWKTRENVPILSKLNFWTKIWLFE